MDSILNTAASMQILADELDRVSIHSSSGLKSSSRESLHSSSKYDSAFDSHYSEDTVSLSSQVLSVSYPVDMETSILPSILTSPVPYRIDTRASDTSKRKKIKRRRTSSPGVSSSPSPSPLVTHQFREDGQSSCSPLVAQSQSSNLSPVIAQQVTREGQSSSIRIRSHPGRTVSHLMSDSSLPTVHQPQHIYVEPSSSPTNRSVNGTESESISKTYQTTPNGKAAISDSHHAASTAVPTIPSSDKEVTPITTLGADEEACFLQHHRQLSECSSVDDLISNDSTPTAERRQPDHSAEGGEETPLSLNPRVTIVYPNTSDSDYSDNSPLNRRHNYFPKTGTLFYQESLTPQQSPLHVASRHKSSTHTLPSRYQDSTHSVQPKSRSVKRSGSILQRLIRKKGSFKEDGILKRRLPVKRSLSDRMAYHIRKGWIDYAEDLDFISHPTHPRAVGRMIDKKAGKYHVVQLYKPANGKYGIYISQTGNKKGIFISRFANSIAEKFYTGLISPGDQIIRVNGRNIGQHSVDDVYDLMTVSDSVIFTVIPVNFRSDW